MKNLAPAVLLFSLMLVCAHRAFAADAKPDPSQYTLAVHISAAAYAPQDYQGAGAFNTLSEIVTAVIDGKHYQLLGPTYSAHTKCCDGLINPGDYHARWSTDEHKTSYESLQELEILFPDGATRRFSVIAQSE
ncbi:MAG: hypothetical protein WBA18_17365 [Terracidiphilus sp.]